MAYDLHIVRSRDWLDAETNPKKKPEVDALITSDRELRWSTTDYVDLKDKGTGAVTRYFAIIWAQEPCFWWHHGGINCSNATNLQIAKMVRMARALRAHVIGDDGEGYELQRFFFGREKVTVLRSTHF